MDRGHGKPFIMASVYMPYEDPDPPGGIVNNLMDEMGSTGHIILGCDANAHHFHWGSSDTNTRGGLKIGSTLNNNLSGNTPTSHPLHHHICHNHSSRASIYITHRTHHIKPLYINKLEQTNHFILLQNKAVTTFNTHLINQHPPSLHPTHQNNSTIINLHPPSQPQQQPINSHPSSQHHLHTQLYNKSATIQHLSSPHITQPQQTVSLRMITMDLKVSE
ncbi:uncharacterized protein [Musca autumnalis]|uniref:uncharacterized protein n=1 Tax=Musca autumnalis TaxID=221902 RepID=UPI003CE9432D